MKKIADERAEIIAKMIRHKIRTGRDEWLKGDEIVESSTPIDFDLEEIKEIIYHHYLDLGGYRWYINHDPATKMYKIYEIKEGQTIKGKSPFLSISEEAIENCEL